MEKNEGNQAQIKKKLGRMRWQKWHCHSPLKNPLDSFDTLNEQLLSI
jgi:hypothetical protein